MSEVKWIKITTDIFDDEKMYAIETLPDGQVIELVWFKILCLAGKCNQNGFLMVSNKIAYTDEMLSKVFRIELGTLQRALDIFQKLEMIELVEDKYMISNWLKHQNVDGLEDIRSKNRERQRKFREKQKILSLEDNSNVTCNVTVTSQNNVISNVTPSLSISNNINSNNTDISILVNNIINKYPNKSSISTGQKKLIDILMNAVDSEGLVNDISIAVYLYLEEHRKKNPDDASYRYVHNFSKFLEEDMPYWLTQVGKKEDSESWEYT